MTSSPAMRRSTRRGVALPPSTPVEIVEAVAQVAPAQKNRRNGSVVSGPAGQGRVARNDATDGVSTLELTRAMYDQPILWELADELPPKTAGAPRKLPEVMYLAGIGYQHIYGSFRNMQAELSEPAIWAEQISIVAEMQRRYRPEQRPIDVVALSATPPLTAQNIHDARRSWAKPALAALRERFEDNAAKIAKEVGYGDPNGRGTLNDLVRERTITTDGKVTTPIGCAYRTLKDAEVDVAKKITRETHVYDIHEKRIISAKGMPKAGVQLYVTGKGPAVGYKTISTALRSDLTNSTVVTSLRVQQTSKEAEEACDAILDVHGRLDNGLLGAVMDAAGTGVHIARLGREAGLVLVTPLKAKSVRGDRVEKSRKAAEIEHELDNGAKCVHEYHTYAGQLAEAIRDDSGTVALHVLPPGHIERRPNKNGFRMYIGWNLTCRVGLRAGAPDCFIREHRFNITAETGRDGFNVAENLRLVAPGTQPYARSYGWRQDEESRNNHRDEAKLNRMARARSPERSYENEVGAAIVRNGLALRLHKKRSPLAGAA